MDRDRPQTNELDNIHLSPQSYDAFAWLLTQLSLPVAPRIVDVGAGGFVGQTTTRHLVKIPDADITAVEISPDRAQRLAEAFGERVKVICGDFDTVELPGTYDLVCVDTDVKVMSIAFKEWLHGRVYRMLNRGGYAIFINLSSWANAIAGGPAIHYGVDDRRRLQDGDVIYDFMLNYWGALEVAPEMVCQKFSKDPFYKAIAVKDKWLAKNIVTWICWEKIG